MRGREVVVKRGSTFSAKVYNEQKDYPVSLNCVSLSRRIVSNKQKKRRGMGGSYQSPKLCMATPLLMLSQYQRYIND